MNSEQPDEKSKKSAAKDEIADDMEALDAFCQGIDFEEISFETWCDQHETLDLNYALPLTKQQATDGCIHKLTLTKKILTVDSEMIRKQKQSHQIEIPPMTKDQDQFVIKGGGDQKGDLCGDLIVIARVT